MAFWVCDVIGDGSDAEGNERRPALADIAAQAGLPWHAAADGASLMLVRCADHAKLSGVEGVRPLRKTALAQIGALDDGETDDWEAPDLALKAVRRLLLRQALGGDDFPVTLSTKLADTGVPLTRLRNRLLAFQPGRPLDLTGIGGQTLVGDALAQLLPQIVARIEPRKIAPSGTFTDNFDGAGSTTALESWTPSGGTAWTLINGVAGGAEVQTSGRLACATTDGFGTAYSCDDQASLDHYSQCAFRNTTGAFAICNRLTNRINWYGARYFSGEAQLYKRVAGTLTSLGGAAIAQFSIVRLESVANDHTVFDDGVSLFGPVNDADVASSTLQGIVPRNATQADWIDTWEAGVLAGGAGAAVGSGLVTGLKFERARLAA